VYVRLIRSRRWDALVECDLAGTRLNRDEAEAPAGRDWRHDCEPT
jgi:hypothetical protein